MTNLTLEYDIYKILKNYKYMQLMKQHNVYISINGLFLLMNML